MLQGDLSVALPVIVCLLLGRRDIAQGLHQSIIRRGKLVDKGHVRIRGGKTVMVLPDGSQAVARRDATVDNTMVKGLACGFRWQRLLYDSTHATIEEIAAAEKINPS